MVWRGDGINRVAACLLTLFDQVNDHYPGRDTSSDGTLGDAAHAATHSEHNPDENGIVRALDITNDPAHGLVSRKLAEALVASRDPRILYVISNEEICSSVVSPWVWRTYGGANPHREHMHLSVVESPSLYDDARPWSIDGIIPVPNPSKRKERITATVFGGAAEVQTSAYDGHVITESELGVSLPYRIKGTRPRVRVYKDGKSVDAEIIDVGPWNTNDPYWQTGSRPQAESGTDMSGRNTNKAGIDLTPAAARAIGLNGKGFVDWEFLTDDDRPAPPPLPDHPEGNTMDDNLKLILITEICKPAPDVKALQLLLLNQPVIPGPIPPVVPPVVAPAASGLGQNLLFGLGGSLISILLGMNGNIGMPFGPDMTSTGLFSSILPLITGLFGLNVPAVNAVTSLVKPKA